MGPQRPFDHERDGVAAELTLDDLRWLEAIERGEVRTQPNVDNDQFQGGDALGWAMCYTAGMIAGAALAIAFIA